MGGADILAALPMVAWIPAAVLVLGSPAAEPEVVVQGACDDASALRQRVRAQVPAPAPINAVQLTAKQVEAEVWEGTLEFSVDGSEHQRVMSAESCAALYEASALVIALTVQPMLEEPPPTSPSEEVPVPPEPSEPVVTETETESDPTETTPEPSRRAESGPKPTDDSSDLRVRGLLGAGVAVGVLHPVHPTTTLGIELVAPRWAVGFDAIYMPPLTIEPATDVQVTMQMLAFDARGCAVWRFADDRVALPLCAGLAVGPAFGRGEGTDLLGRSGRQPWLGALFGPRLQLHARWGGDLWLATDLVAPLRRLNFVVGSVGTVCCEQPLGFMMSLGGAFSGPR